MQKVREAIIKEAREWVGTPFHHQASLKGAGADCVGLVSGVGIACGVVEVPPSAWRRYARYGRRPNPRVMREGMEEFLVQIDSAEATIGDVIWLQWRENLPMHLAILSEIDGRRTMIHSFSEIGSVVEHTVSDLWATRINSWWRYPGVK